MSMIGVRFGKSPSVRIPSVSIPKPTFQAPIRF
jgi:hypothetical protein